MNEQLKPLSKNASLATSRGKMLTNIRLRLARMGYRESTIEEQLDALTAKLAELTVENERLRGEIPKYAKHFDVEKYYTDKDGE